MYAMVSKKKTTHARSFQSAISTKTQPPIKPIMVIVVIVIVFFFFFVSGYCISIKKLSGHRLYVHISAGIPMGIE